MEGPHNFACSLQLFVKPGCTSQCLIYEYLGQTISLQGQSEQSVHEGNSSGVSSNQLMCNDGSFGESRSDFYR